MTPREFRDRLQRRAKCARIAIPAEIAERLEAYVRLLAQWNAKINLTALPLREPTDETFDRLLIEPLAAARYVDDSWTPWFDLGSGSGSPAIPLKIAKPPLNLTMVESKARKAAFLREAIRTLGLADSVVENARFQEVANRSNAVAGLVTVRAVRPDAALVDAAARLLRADGRLLLFRHAALAQQYEGFVHEKASQLTETPQRLAVLLTYCRVFRNNIVD